MMSGWSIPNEARRSRSQDRQARFEAALREGALVKQAAFAAGVSERTATRYRSGRA
jgi:transposase